jgi:uncharacterized membrane protein YuzA (DUF378 family)
MTGREFTNRDRESVTSKVMTPPATEKWLLASVMAVVWGILASLAWTLLAVGFGRSKSNARLITMLVICAVLVALLCAHAYRQGWKGRHNASSRSSL